MMPAFTLERVVPKTAKILHLPPRAAGYELVVTLRDVEPAVWRRLLVAGSLTLRELHHVLQIAFEWNDSHLHEFKIRGHRYGLLAPDGEEYGEPPIDEREIPLDAVVRLGDRFEYEYDFGDGWTHAVVVEKAVADPKPKAACLEGARAAPPDDCGGPGGYERLLEVLGKPRHPEYRELRGWVGVGFAPERFDLAAVNRALRGAGTAAFRRKRERSYEGA